MRAPRFFRIGTGHQTRRRPLASSFAPQTSFVRERCFVASCNRSLSPRPSGSLATLADRTRRAQCLRQPTVASCIPARWPQVTPGPVGHATAPNRELRRRDLQLTTFLNPSFLDSAGEPKASPLALVLRRECPEASAPHQGSRHVASPLTSLNCRRSPPKAFSWPNWATGNS